MSNVRLPNTVKNAEELKSLLELLASVKDDDVVDFTDFRFYIPAAIVAVLAMLKKKCARIGPSQDKAPRYLLRIDFFKIARPGLIFKENFVRREALTFSTIQTITQTSSEQEIAQKICADVIKNVKKKKQKLDTAASENIRRTITYAVGEIFRNVVQHSGANGFVFSQYFPATDFVHIGIADYGIGISESFRQCNSEFYDPENDDDVSLLEKAMHDRTSSKFNMPSPPYGMPENQGVGLTRVDSICELLFGRFFIASGNACYSRDGIRKTCAPLGNFSFPGTVVGIEIPMLQLDNYPFDELIIEAEGVSDESEMNAFDNLFV